MPEIHFHSSYLTSDRGITKIVQIVLGLVVCSILCANWYGGMSCFGEGRIGFASGLNFFTLVVNIILFLLNLFNIRLYKLEQCISVVMVILFTLAIILLIWLMIANGNWDVWLIIATVAMIMIDLLYNWDFKANRSISDDHLPI